MGVLVSVLILPAGLALTAALALVAFLYASVGHAGASGYIAVLALAGQSPPLIKPLALMLNTVVASVGCWNFLQAGHLPWRRFWPLLLLAVPGAFLGGSWNLPGVWFERLVGGVLLFSAWRFGIHPHDPPSYREPSAPLLTLVGGGLGLLAGLTGTGGGVFLTPLLLLFRWCSTRQAAAVSVVFILFNSLAGLAGLLLARPAAIAAVLTPQLLVWLAVVLLAGAIGSRLGSRHWPVAWIRRSLALVLLLASLKLLGLGELL
ncbi:sulfite exporter TauE/SafE family protein [Synechococcus sp. CS-1328]|nr:sulfite exporter TauE/SafE family protein [Synechococcus sp. CS-1328]